MARSGSTGSAPAARGPAPCTPADEIDRSGWTVTASGEGDPGLVRDGDNGTAWRTERPQKPGDRLEIHLPAPDTVTAIALSLGYPYDEFPRNLVLMSTTRTRAGSGSLYADGPEERWSTLEDLLQRPREARLVLRLPARRVRAVRLMVGLREEDLSWPRWRVPEATLFRDCR